MYLGVAFTAHNGKLLVAEGGGGREVLANRPGIGPWETFRLFNRTRSDGTLQSGDSVALQAWNGRFVSAADLSALLKADLPWIDAGSTFIITKAEGHGQIHSGENIYLITSRHTYVYAETDGNIRMRSPTPIPRAIFRITLFHRRMIHLRSAAGRYVAAEGGGAGQATANRGRIGPWETFTAVNLSRIDNTFRSGDTVAFQAWNGNYLRVLSGTQCDVRANAATTDAQFLLTLHGDGTVHHNSLRAHREISGRPRLPAHGRRHQRRRPRHLRVGMGGRNGLRMDAGWSRPASPSIRQCLGRDRGAASARPPHYEQHDAAARAHQRADRVRPFRTCSQPGGVDTGDVPVGP